MNDIVIRAKPLAGNHKGIKDDDVLLLGYTRPSVRGSVSESGRIGKSLKFGSPKLGKFTVVATVGNHAQGGLDWVTNSETIDKVEVVKQHIVNGSLSIVAKDIYQGVTLQSYSIVFKDDADIPIIIYMQFVAKSFQLANVDFTHSTKAGATHKATVLNNKRKVKN